MNRALHALILAAVLGGCASSRLIRVENAVLTQRTTDLERRIAELEKTAPSAEDFVRSPDMDTVRQFLGREGYIFTDNPKNPNQVKLEYIGRNSTFGVNIQYFGGPKVLFIATSGYLTLEESNHIDSVVLLLVQLVTVNFDLLIGKFQLNPETGEIILSTEIPLADGLGFHALIGTMKQLCEGADARYPDLLKVAQGQGY